jgi:hypothetical protein
VYSAPDDTGARAKKSELHGCQYLHSYIPGVGLPVTGKLVRYELLGGTAHEYRRKVYREKWDGQVSVDEYGPERDHLAWDLRQAYDVLWRRWAASIKPLHLDPGLAKEAARVKRQIVLCTVPAPQLCLRQEDHKFVTQGIWAMGSITPLRVDPSHGAPPGFKPSNMPYRAPDMTVQCNGEDAPRWYRAATVFGASTLEWPAGVKPPISGVAAVQKPLSTDCDCNVSKLWVRLGRYGKWEKGVLVHTAYEEVMAL